MMYLFHGKNHYYCFLGDADDQHETGSVITMTSDERVQIFVPSPQGTPYNTITKTSSGTPCIGSANLAPLFAPNRASAETYRSLTPLNFSASPAPPPGKKIFSRRSFFPMK